MLWIALFLPELSLQLATRAGIESQSVNAKPTEPVGLSDLTEQSDHTSLPLIIASGPQNRPLVFAANATAQAAGIRVGMTVATARTLTHILTVVTRSVADEALAVHNLAAWASQFTPSVTIQAAGTDTNNAVAEGILLEVSATLTLHGGLAKLLGLLKCSAHQLGYHLECGVAPTPKAAWIFAKARHHSIKVRACTDIVEMRRRLSDLPLALLDWPHLVLTQLSGLGIVRFGECLALPQDGFAQRFGQDRLADLMRLTGVLPDPREWFQLPETYQARTEFGFEVNDALALLFPLNRLLNELEGFLRARGAGVTGYRLVLSLSNKGRTTIHIGTATPVRHAARLLALAREHLQKTVLAATVLALGLVAERLQPYQETSASWLPDPHAPAENWHQLIDTLTARLGTENVMQLQVLHDHRPEASWQTNQVQSALSVGRGKAKRGGVKRITSPNSSSPRISPNTLSTRPTFLLPVPRKLITDNGMPLCHGRVTLLAGPERIETGWWDGKPAKRDYYVGRNCHGETLWLFRDLQSSMRHSMSTSCPTDTYSDEQSVWHLHGIFA